MSEAQQIGALLPGIAQQSGSTALQPPSTRDWQTLNLASLPARLDDSVLPMVREIANSSLPEPECCDDEHFFRCLKSLDILPRRSGDALSGKAFTGLYKRHLGGFSNEAMSYLAETATGTCQWFPTIAECLEILKAWPNRSRDHDRRETARHLVQREMDARLGEVLKLLEREELDQAAIDALPDQWKRVAATKSLLWGWPDGRFTLRRDLSRLSPDEAEAEREKNRAMFAEWEKIEAEIAAAEGSAAE